MQYTIKKKRKMIEKITRLQKKNQIKIYDILTSNNVDVTFNDNGCFLFFHNLEDKVYSEIEKYLKSIDKLYLNSVIASDMQSTPIDYIPYIEDNYSLEKEVESKYRLTTREKNFIKMTEYNKNIEIENNLNDDVEYGSFDMVGNMSETF